MDEIKLKTLTQLALPVAILAAALIVSGTLIYTKSATKGNSPSVGDANKPVSIKLNPDDHVLGNKDAKVTIVEFSDFQCPFCRRFWVDSFPQLKSNYIDTGKAKLVYRHFPLDFHPSAVPAAKAAECASEQGKFWEMHDKIFGEQEKKGQGTVTFTVADLKNWAKDIGLGGDVFSQCLDSDKYSQRISSDLNYGTSIGISGTPTFFINGQRIVGAQPYSVFQAAIEGLLKK